MPQVMVTINKRQTRLACEDGEEGHLLQLCSKLDGEIARLRAEHGEIGDARLMLMAALQIADELHDTAERVSKLEQELATLRNARSAAADRTQANQAAIVDAFNAAAERIEQLSKQLNQGLSSEVAIG
jgi:cell division protein ZapA